jgi:hypothetical protein
MVRDYVVVELLIFFCDSIVGIATAYGLDDQGGGVLIPSRVKNFLFTSSTPAVGSIQPPIQWVQGAVSPGGKAEGMRS